MRVPEKPGARDEYLRLRGGDNTGVISEVGAAALDEFVRDRPARKPRSVNGSAERQLFRAREECEVLAKGGEWVGAAPRHFVALYADLHEKVYETRAAEVGRKKDFLGACSAAGRLLREEFGGENRAFADYMRWVWRREREREKRRTNGDGRRITWQLMFASRALLTDYRVATRGAR